MVRKGPNLTAPAVTPNEAIPMDDPLEPDRIHELIPIGRCRELLGRDGRELSDEDIDAIRRHAHAMAHTLIDVFLHRQIDGRG